MPPRNGRTREDCSELLAEVEELHRNRGTASAISRIYAELHNTRPGTYSKNVTEMRALGVATRRVQDNVRAAIDEFRRRGGLAGEVEPPPPEPEPLGDDDFVERFEAGTLPGPILDERWLIYRPEVVPAPTGPGDWHCWTCGDRQHREFGAKVEPWDQLHLCRRCWFYPVLPPPVLELNLYVATRGNRGAYYSADEIETWLDALADSLKNPPPTKPTTRTKAPPADLPETDAELRAFDRALDARLTAHEASELDLATAGPLEWRAFLSGDPLTNGHRPPGAA